jgi:hypothetical protein
MTLAPGHTPNIGIIGGGFTGEVCRASGLRRVVSARDRHHRPPHKGDGICSGWRMGDASGKFWWARIHWGFRLNLADGAMG